VPKLSIQLSAETLKEMRTTASSEGLSPSDWVTYLITEKLAELRGAEAWSEDFSALAGAWSDMPSLDEISSAQRQNSGK